MNSKYIFEEYMDHYDCDDCGISSNSIYHVYVNDEMHPCFSTGSNAYCYRSEYPSLIDLHNYCINDLKLNVKLDINNISSLEQLVNEYASNGIDCSYIFEEAWLYNDCNYEED